MATDVFNPSAQEFVKSPGWRKDSFNLARTASIAWTKGESSVARESAEGALKFQLWTEILFACIANWCIGKSPRRTLQTAKALVNSNSDTLVVPTSAASLVNRR